MLADEEDRLEKEHWESVMAALLSYSEFVSLELERRQAHINRLHLEYADRLPKVTFEKFAAIERAAKINQEFRKLLSLVQVFLTMEFQLYYNFKLYSKLNGRFLLDEPIIGWKQ